MTLETFLGRHEKESENCLYVHAVKSHPYLCLWCSWALAGRLHVTSVP